MCPLSVWLSSISLLILLFCASVNSRVIGESRTDNETTSLGEIEAEIKGISQDLPRAEWNAFWKKLTSAFSGSPRTLQDMIKKNEGDLNKTISDLRDQLGDRFEDIQSSWLKTERKIKQVVDDLTSIKARNLWETTKSRFMEVLADFDLKDPQKTATTIKSKLTGLWDSFTEGIRSVIPSATATTTESVEIRGADV